MGIAKNATYSLAFGFVAACSSAGDTKLNTPAVQAFLALPPAQYAATHDIGEEVADGCLNYRFDVGLVQQLRQILRDNGVRQARANAVDLERDVARRSFQAKHGIVLGQDNTCAAIQRELEDATPISALFLPN